VGQRFLVRHWVLEHDAGFDDSPARIKGNFAHAATVLLAFCNMPILEFGNRAMFFPLFAINACTRAIITTIESGKSITVRGGRGDVSPIWPR
jgi:hypothetical protein